MSTSTKRFVMLAAGLLVFGATVATASAAPRIGGGVRFFAGPRVVVAPHAGFRTWGYDPYWGPWYPYPYAYGYPVPVDRNGNAALRTDVTPKQAGHLDVAPGPHQVTLYLDGFRTQTQDVYVRPDSTFKMNATMERLRRGELSAPAPSPSTPPTE